MPYYRELDFLDERQTRSPVITGSEFPPLGNLRFGTSFRTYPKSQYYMPVEPHLVDPYAWFLSNTAERRVTENGQVYKPDRGHMWHSEKHTATMYSTYFASPAGDRPCTAFASPGGKNFVPVGGMFNFGAGSMATLPTDDLAAFGQQAIVKTAPAPSVFSGSQFLGELREGLPKLVGAALIKGRVKDVLKNAGSEYLNFEFGWEPLVADVKTLATTLLQLDSVLESKRKLQGKPRKAKFALPPLEQFQEARAATGNVLLSNVRSLVAPAPYSTWINGRKDSGTWAVNASGTNLYFLRTVKRWRRFEGLFTSYFDYPSVDTSWIQKANALVSMDLTPTVLWELAPWSWLVDWVFHIQNCITSNSVGNDKRVVMNYGYVTEHTVYRSLFTASVNGLYTWPASNRSLAVHSEDVFSRRIRANPFGFQITNPDTLNASQIGILAALGSSWRK